MVGEAAMAEMVKGGDGKRQRWDSAVDASLFEYNSVQKRKGRKTEGVR